MVNIGLNNDYNEFAIDFFLIELITYFDNNMPIELTLIFNFNYFFGDEGSLRKKL